MGNMMRTRRLHARLAYVRRLHERLSYVVRVDDRVSQRSARRGHAGRVKSGRAVHRCIRSACRSRRCVGLCSVVVAVLADTAEQYNGEHDAYKTTACTLSLREATA